MDGFDPLTCGSASRSRVDEDDEAAAEAAALSCPPAPPLATFTPAFSATAAADGKTATPLLVRRGARGCGGQTLPQATQRQP